MTVAIVSVGFIILTVGTHLAILRGLHALLPRLHFLRHQRIGLMFLIVIFGHLLEIGMFACGLAWLVSAGQYGNLHGNLSPDFQDYFYYSAVTYTSLGYGDLTPVGDLRTFASVEALTGLLLIAWTASFTYMAMQRFWTEEHPE